MLFRPAQFACGAYNYTVWESVRFASERSRVRVSSGPPYMRNPNFRPVGQGFGFLVYITDIVIRDI